MSVVRTDNHCGGLCPRFVTADRESARQNPKSLNVNALCGELINSAGLPNARAALALTAQRLIASISDLNVLCYGRRFQRSSGGLCSKCGIGRGRECSTHRLIHINLP